MIATPAIYYQALLNKNSEYEGIFYVGVKTTGVFCRPTCPARKPKFENCEWFESANHAMQAGYRPCQRCQPLVYPNQIPPLVRTLIAAVDAEPDRKWRQSDVRDVAADPSTVRRYFKKRFGMTFVEYARARRMGVALSHLREGASVIDAQLATGYDSGSGFRDAFARIIGTPPARQDDSHVLHAAWVDTPVGPMITIASDTGLYLLEFTDGKRVEREIEKLRRHTHAAIVPGSNAILTQIEEELTQYFNGTLTEFRTPVALWGTDFQKSVWMELLKIPHGETRSYTDLSDAIGNRLAIRAVAQANGANPLAIIVPCHRVIGADGTLTGYGGGLHRKQWLLHHEKRAVQSEFDFG